VIVALTATVGYAIQRELAPKVVHRPLPALSSAGARALTLQEEAYAAALWSVHSEVKLAAVRMSFAGIAYKTDDPDARRLEGKVRPLVEGFASAEAKVLALNPPASLREVHDRYLEAVTLYESASALTVKAAEEGRDEMLVDAQGMSFRAAEDLLKVGDVLWPGEYKPN
jgi:hypothetical protein